LTTHRCNKIANFGPYYQIVEAARVTEQLRKNQNKQGKSIMEKNIFSFIGLTLVLTLSCGVVQSALGVWHEHTDNIKIISIERNSVNVATNLVAIGQ
jgi:hypothetical protein